MTNNELLSQLQNLLTQEDFDKKYIYIPFDIGISAQIRINENMVDRIKDISPYGDYIIGFVRDEHGFCLILDEEGQKLWNEKTSEKLKWIDRYGSE